ncbi:MAG: diguanylate cyclase [bacterium]
MVRFEQPHILLIDSDPEWRASAQKYIQRDLQLPCTASPSVYDYSSSRQLQQYSVILIDINAPHGLHLLRECNSRHMDVMMIILILQPNSFPFEEIIHWGAYDYLVKPINFLEMKAKIRKALRERMLFRELRQKQEQLELIAKSALENHDELENRTAEMNVEREALRSELDGYKQMVENAVDMIFSIDIEGRIESVNKTMLEVLGYSREDMIGKNISSVIHPDFILRLQNALKTVSETKVIKGVELTLTTKTSGLILTEMNAVSRYGYLGNFIGLWAILRDITERKRLEEELKELSIIDSLTKLYNKRYFLEILEKEIYRACRQKYPLSMIMIDLDRFKSHNDTYGHLAGDYVLSKVGEMLSNQCRGGVDVPCRYGGDEFTIVLPQVDQDQAVRVACRYQRAWGKMKVGNIGFSIGIAQYNGHSTREEFIRKVDKAMYRSKWAGGDKVSVS